MSKVVLIVLICVVGCNYNDPSRATYPWRPTPAYPSIKDAGPDVHDAGADVSVDR